MLRTMFASQPMSASRISPLRGSTCEGPMAPKEGVAVAIQRIEEKRVSPRSSVESSACCATCRASLKPTFSNALFHSRMPRRIGSRYRSGISLPRTKRMGFFGVESAAAGSLFSRRQRCTYQRTGEKRESSLKLTFGVAKWPTRESARRGAIGSAGSGEKL
jgi:hypothetical protein